MENTRTSRPFFFFLLLAPCLLIAGGCGTEEKQPPSGPPEALTPPVDTLLTCRICGYRTLPNDSASCPVCYVQLSPAEVIAWGYRSMEEMIREEQAMFFAAEGYREQQFFTEPRVWEMEGASFQKDSTWEPQISEEFVLRMRDTLINAGVIE